MIVCFECQLNIIIKQNHQSVFIQFQCHSVYSVVYIFMFKVKIFKSVAFNSMLMSYPS